MSSFADVKCLNQTGNRIVGPVETSGAFLSASAAGDAGAAEAVEAAGAAVVVGAAGAAGAVAAVGACSVGEATS